jgi:hypothetical protein
MPTLTIIDRPIGTFQSVYDPIKISCRVNDTNREKYPSVVAIVTPYDTINNEYEYDNQIKIRVPVQPKVPENIDQDSWSATSTLYYSIDLSTICRDFVSFDLRPCTHDTQEYSRKDITQGQISYNTFKYFSVTMRLEFIDTDGVLKEDSSAQDSTQWFPINSAISNDERQGIYFDEIAYDGEGVRIGAEYYIKYLHFPSRVWGTEGRAKYLTTKPTRHRVIGEDEIEYISFLAQRDTDANEDVYGQIRFYDLDGNVITDNTAGSLRLSFIHTAKGNGTYRSKLLDGQFTLDTESRAVVQVGVGTRNIAHTSVGYVNQTDGEEVIMDFRGISKYEFETLRTTTSSEVGEKVTYYIDHDQNNIGKVRVHWQNRLGGIDSYTFYDTSIRGLNVSSQTFEQTIYPRFGDQISLSTSNNNYLSSSLEAGTGGVIKGERHAISKSKVKAFREGQLVSRPINSKAEEEMFNDLMSSPRVWIEGGWKKKEVFRDNFNYYTSGTGFAANWTISGVSPAFAARTADHPLATIGRLMSVGDGSGNDEGQYLSKELIPYDYTKLYEFEIRLKRNGGTGIAYFGFVGYASDGVTKINTSGNDSNSSSHYVALSGYSFPNGGDEYSVHRGYVSGYASSGAGGQKNDPNRPAYAYNGIKFLAPFIICNHNGESGITRLDYVKVTEISSDIPNQHTWLNTQNRAYYTPIIIKDGGMTTFDSNNLSKITLNYVHSKEEKTIM